MKWYLAVLKKYATFSGRARRKEYWMFVLFNIIFMIVAMILDNLFHITYGHLSGLNEMAAQQGMAGVTIPYGIITTLYALAVVVPSIAVAVRRLHDTGRSGAWYFIMFVPFIGSIWLLVLMLLAGNPGDNQYGPDPKAGL